MSTSRERILGRLRQARAVRPAHGNPVTESDRAWRARQAPMGDPAERFVREQESVGGQVRRVAGWDALGDVVVPWLAEQGVRSVLLGTAPRLEPLAGRLAAEPRFTVARYGEGHALSREAVFGADCGITTTRGAIAETGSLIVVPGPEEPRLLSLAPPVHLAVVERGALVPTLGGFIESGAYQRELPGNLVLITGASRTADIELTLAVGVHGPGVMLVALIDGEPQDGP